MTTAAIQIFYRVLISHAACAISRLRIRDHEMSTDILRAIRKRLPRSDFGWSFARRRMHAERGRQTSRQPFRALLQRVTAGTKRPLEICKRFNSLPVTRPSSRFYRQVNPIKSFQLVEIGTERQILICKPIFGICKSSHNPSVPFSYHEVDPAKSSQRTTIIMCICS